MLKRDFCCYLKVAFQNPLKRIGTCTELILVFEMVTYQTCLIPNAAPVTHGITHTRQFLQRRGWIHTVTVCLVPLAFDLHVIHIQHAGFHHLILEKVTEFVSQLKSFLFPQKYPYFCFLGQPILLQQIKKKCYSIWIQVRRPRIWILNFSRTV